MCMASQMLVLVEMLMTKVLHLIISLNMHGKQALQIMEAKYKASSIEFDNQSISKLR